MSEQEAATAATVESESDLQSAPAAEGSPNADAETPAAADTEQIDPVLVEKLTALKMIVKVDALLQKGIFLGQLAEDVLLAKEFLKNLHGPILKEAQAHPDWDRVTTGPPKPADLEAIAKAEEKRNRKDRRAAQGH